MSWQTLIPVRPVRLWPADPSQSRRASWLEFFFDLIFVAAVAQVGVPLSEDYRSRSGALRAHVLAHHVAEAELFNVERHARDPASRDRNHWHQLGESSFIGHWGLADGRA